MGLRALPVDLRGPPVGLRALPVGLRAPPSDRYIEWHPLAIGYGECHTTLFLNDSLASSPDLRRLLERTPVV